MNLLEQESHVGSQGAHGLHAFGIEFHLALAAVLMTAAPVAAIVAFLIKSLLSIF